MILLSSAIRGRNFIAFFLLIKTVSIQIRAANLRYLANSLDKVLANSMKAENIETNLRYFSKSPHVAGTPRNNELAQHIVNEWKKLGFDQVEMPSYNVTISLPCDNKPSKVQIVDHKEKVIFQAAQMEKPLLVNESQPGILPAYLAFSPSGSVQGDVVYAHYGRTEDYEALAKMGVSVKGNVVLLRMGRLFRGNKVQKAEKYGAAGVLLYTDPHEFAPEGPNNTFPRSFWLPDTGIQRGGVIYSGIPGDPKTPGLPSIDGMYRTTNNNFMSTVPSYQLSYGDASEILRLMKGHKVPRYWKLNLPFEYRTGPGFRNSTFQLKLMVNNELKTRQIFNVIGTIRGSLEPDRYVLMGNHRDAWVYGAADPSSGTSILMEVSRGLGRLLKSGWRPRRTIKLCSWDAEEFILLGSTEWAEENAKVLFPRAVAYLNMDTAVSGNWSLNVDGSPLLQDFLISLTKQVNDPTASDLTMYDIMAKRDLAKSKGHPRCGNLDFGSDYAAFAHSLGITSADWSYIFGGHHNIRRSYPVYHSLHDSFYWMKTFVDPDFKIHLAVAQYAGIVLLNIADRPLLPFNTITLADTMKQNLRQLKKSNFIKRNGISLTYLLKAIKTFEKASKRFENEKEKLKSDTSFIQLRVMNDQLLQVERAFIQDKDKYSGNYFKHVLYGPDIENFYSGICFPRLQRAMKTSAGKDNLEAVKKQLSLVTYAILSAAKVLEPVF